MRNIILPVLFLLISSFQGPKFYKVKINKQVSLLISTNLVPVPAEDLASKFISYRSPLAAYTNMSTEIEFGINTSVSRWRESDFSLMKLFYKSNIASLFDEVEFLKEEIRIINKRDFAVFEFVSKINPEEKSAIDESPVIKYTYIQYSIVKGTVYIFDFSCPADQQNIWQEEVGKMMGER